MNSRAYSLKVTEATIELLAVMVLLFLQDVAGAQHQPTVAPNPYVIMERHFAAIGGARALDALESTYFDGVITVNNNLAVGRFRSWDIGALFRYEATFPGYKHVSAANGACAWIAVNDSAVSFVEDTIYTLHKLYLATSTAESILDSSSQIFRLRLLGLRHVDTAACWQIEMINNITKDTSVLCIDTATYYELKSIEKTRVGSEVVIRSDFHRFSGFVKPRSLRVISLPDSVVTSIKNIDYQFNVSIDSGLFSPPGGGCD